MILRVSDIIEDIARFVDGSGVDPSCDRERVIKEINRATRELMDDGDWPGAEAEICLDVNECCITLDERFESIRAAAPYMGNPMTVYSSGFKFLHGGAPFSCCGPVYEAIEDLGDGYATHKDPATASHIVAFSDKQEADDACLEIRGIDGNNKEVLRSIHIRHSNAASAPPAYTGPDADHWTDGKYSRVTELRKPRTNGYVYVYAYNPDTKEFCWLTTIRPDTISPSHRRYRIPGGDQCAQQIVAKVALRFYPVYRDDDVLLIQHQGALERMVQSLACLDNKDMAGYQSLRNSAISRLKKRLEKRDRSGKTGLNIKVQGTPLGGRSYAGRGGVRTRGGGIGGSCCPTTSTTQATTQTCIPSKGDKGDKGEKGDNGLTAYQVAVAAGYSGTVDEWLASLQASGLPEGGEEGQVIVIVDGEPVWDNVAGTGDVVGPASAVSGNFPTFDGTTGKLIADGGVSASSFATSAQGTLADSALQPGDNVSELTNDSGFTDDQTGAEIKAAYEGESDTNAFTDAEKAKLASLFGGANKLDATAAPTANDDSADTSGNGAFSVGSVWIDLTGDEVYRCVDATPTAAVWVNTSLTVSELAAVAVSGNFSDLSGTLTTAQIGNNQVTNGKLAQMAEATIKGRAASAGTGDASDLSATQVRSILNIEDGADVTNAARVNAAGALMDSEVTNLSGIKTLSVPDNTTISAFGASLIDDSDAATARTTLGVDAAGTDNSTDVTIAAGRDYISITDQELTLGEVDLTADVTGALPLANGGTGATTAAGARTALDVDQAGTDNSTDVTLVTTSHDYLSLAGQAITLGAIDLTADVTGDLPLANLAQASAASKLLGRGSASGAGDFEEISLGSGLSMSGTTLSASASAPAMADITNYTETAVSTGEVVAYTGAGYENQTLAEAGIQATISFGTGVETALGVNIGSAGAPVLLNGAGGTPSALTLTNATGLPLSSGVTGTLPVANGGTGQTSAANAANALNTAYLGPQALTSGASVSWDCSSGRSATLTLGHDAELQVPTNLADGQTASLSITQDGTGGRALTLASGLTIMTGNLADVSGMAAGDKAEVSVKRVSSDYRVFIVIEA